MSYSRYFKIATAMAAYRPTSARQNTTFSTGTAALSAEGLIPICGASASGMIVADHEQAGHREPLQLEPFLTRGPG